MSQAEWAAIAAVLVVLGGGLPVVRILTRRSGTSAEVSRKAIHIMMGMVCMTLPWCFARPEPVWALAAVATIPLMLLRLVPALREGLGSTLHGVKRPSYGEVLFAPAVALVFDLAAGDAFLFCIPVAVLTLADAAGALGGTRWGRHRYGAGEGFKSLEGSAVFFLTAFACVWLPLWLGGRVDMGMALWIGLIVGLLAMMAEGLADRGFDNLLIPIGCYFVLDRLLDLDHSALVWRFGVAVFFLGLVLSGSKWSTLSGGALLGCALLGYSCAILADPRFILPPVAVFVCHVFATRRHRLVGKFDHRLDAVLSHAIGCLPWVLAVERGVLAAETGLAGISFAMANQLGMMTVATHASVHDRQAYVTKTMLKAWGCGALPGLLWLWRDWNGLAVPLAMAVAISWIAIMVFRKMSPQPGSNATRLWVIQGLVALLCSLPAIWFAP
jgi:phytol kinase